MKITHAHIGLSRLCGWFGITRQAYYQHTWHQTTQSLQQELVLQQVHRLRKLHPRMGVRKLYLLMGEFLKEHKVKMGRDALFELLAQAQLLVKKRKRTVRTTLSSHWLHKYANLIKEANVDQPNRIWMSDITYWRIDSGQFVYISFITDAFSHKIVGYHVADNLAAVETIKALRMALNQLQDQPQGLVHHSDRGVQYCSTDYVKELCKNQIGISMTENGDPYENALAERINGILKDEYLHNYKVTNLLQAKTRLKTAVELYNNHRPHNSLENLTPNQVHQHKTKTRKLWKNYKSLAPLVVEG